jgi:hypothetical protein
MTSFDSAGPDALIAAMVRQSVLARQRCACRPGASAARRPSAPPAVGNGLTIW